MVMGRAVHVTVAGVDVEIGRKALRHAHCHRPIRRLDGRRLRQLRAFSQAHVETAVAGVQHQRIEGAVDREAAVAVRASIVPVELVMFTCPSLDFMWSLPEYDRPRHPHRWS